MLIESNRDMTARQMTDWLEDNYAMSEQQANAAYKAWTEDVA
jgi:hypothetical protein